MIFFAAFPRRGPRGCAAGGGERGQARGTRAKPRLAPPEDKRAPPPGLFRGGGRGAAPRREGSAGKPAAPGQSRGGATRRQTGAPAGGFSAARSLRGCAAGGGGRGQARGTRDKAGLEPPEDKRAPPPGAFPRRGPRGCAAGRGAARASPRHAAERRGARAGAEGAIFGGRRSGR